MRLEFSKADGDLERRAFELYLRTGLTFRPQNSESSLMGLKYNHNHDPANGRFTFSNGSGFNRGSDGFGGGGASGSFGNRVRPLHARNTVSPPIATPRTGIASTPPKQLDRKPAAKSPATGSQMRHISKNGYDFEIDHNNRTMSVKGTLTLNPAQTRSRSAQARAGGSDRLPTDHGGHYIARRFNGPTEAYNHFAQDGKFNNGEYRRLENKWEKAVRSGHRVTVNITPLYRGNSMRPSDIVVRYKTDGKRIRRKFPNSAKGH